ncbi:MAG: hypothetical protein ACRCRW_06010 [Aeromonadaceae bacterium]
MTRAENGWISPPRPTMNSLCKEGEEVRAPIIGSRLHQKLVAEK